MSDTHCAICGAAFSVYEKGCTGGAGYAIRSSDNAKICYNCCGKLDEAELVETGKLVGYLIYKQEPKPWSRTGREYLKNAFFTNWPETLKIPVTGSVNRSINNFGAERIDFWLRYKGARYWGVNIGDNQIARVKRVKG